MTRLRYYVVEHVRIERRALSIEANELTAKSNEESLQKPLALLGKRSVSVRAVSVEQCASDLPRRCAAPRWGFGSGSDGAA